MECWIGESPYDKKNKDNLYQKISKLKWNELNSNMNFAYPDMIKVMNKAQRGLKKVDLVKTRSKIELERYERGSEPGRLWQDKQVAAFYFFVTMLGYIDAKINLENKRIEFNSNFLSVDDLLQDKTHYQEIEKARNRIEKMLIDRKKVLEDYNIFMTKNCISDSVKKVLYTVPSCNMFGELYEDSLKNHDYQIKLISAYNIGFLDPYGDYEEKMNKYRFLFNDLLKTININKAELEAIKLQNKMRKNNEKRKRI